MGPIRSPSYSSLLKRIYAENNANSNVRIGFAESKIFFVRRLLTDIVFQFGGTSDLQNLAFCSVRAYIGFGNPADSKGNTRFCSTALNYVLFFLLCLEQQESF